MLRGGFSSLLELIGGRSAQSTGFDTDELALLRLGSDEAKLGYLERKYTELLAETKEYHIRKEPSRELFRINDQDPLWDFAVRKYLFDMARDLSVGMSNDVKNFYLNFFAEKFLDTCLSYAKNIDKFSSLFRAADITEEKRLDIFHASVGSIDEMVTRAYQNKLDCSLRLARCGLKMVRKLRTKLNQKRSGLRIRTNQKAYQNIMSCVSFACKFITFEIAMQHKDWSVAYILTQRLMREELGKGEVHHTDAEDKLLSGRAKVYLYYMAAKVLVHMHRHKEAFESFDLALSLIRQWNKTKKRGVARLDVFNNGEMQTNINTVYTSLIEYCIEHHQFKRAARYINAISAEGEKARLQRSLDQKRKVVDALALAKSLKVGSILKKAVWISPDQSKFALVFQPEAFALLTAEEKLRFPKAGPKNSERVRLFKLDDAFSLKQFKSLIAKLKRELMSKPAQKPAVKPKKPTHSAEKGLSRVVKAVKAEASSEPAAAYASPVSQPRLSPKPVRKKGAPKHQHGVKTGSKSKTKTKREARAARETRQIPGVQFKALSYPEHADKLKPVKMRGSIVFYASLDPALEQALGPDLWKPCLDTFNTQLIRTGKRVSYCAKEMQDKGVKVLKIRPGGKKGNTRIYARVVDQAKNEQGETCYHVVFDAYSKNAHSSHPTIHELGEKEEAGALPMPSASAAASPL